MTCDELESRLGAYVDEELDPAAREEVERHLHTCLACQSLLVRERALSTAIRAQVPTYTAPDLLRARVEGALRAARTTSDPVPAAAPVGAPLIPPVVARGVVPLRRWRSAALAASALFVVTAGYGVVMTAAYRGRATPGTVSPDEILAHDVLSSHVRSLMPDHLTDVASTDQHNVKPWFNGKLDYSPPVYDLAPQGFPLIGGRVDYVASRPVAALIYQRRKHIINLLVWPTEPAGRPAPGATPEITRQGYHLLHWTRGGMTYWAVSDLNGAELREFVRLDQQMDSLATTREELR